MGLSETILAAMIGAVATITTALFQIFSSIRNRNKIDVKPRRGTATRSVLAVLALMIASAAGGFLYSELLKQRDGQELREMRAELRELKEIATAARAPIQSPPPVSAPEPQQEPAALPVHLMSDTQRAESVAYVPACRRISVEGQLPLACAETEAQRIALCGSIPSYARIQNIDLFAQKDAVQRPWDEHRATLEQDLGGARFTGKSFEYAQSAELKAVCVNFVQWSSDHSHIARIVVNYGFGDVPTLSEPEDPITPAPAVIAAESLPTLPQQASFVTSTKP
jgi:hypothetical protein